MADLDISDLRALNGGRAGIVDVACPSCGPSRHAPTNRLRTVLRIWDEGDFVTYRCARCGINGWAVDKAHAATAPAVMPPRPAQRDRAALAQYLWGSSLPLPGSLAERYLQARGCSLVAPSLRFLPAKGNYHPAMIARFGSGPVTGVHLTRLRTDGSGKAGSDRDKMMIGQSLGQPIIVHDNPERDELVVAEGIEDAASLALATGWSAWAAGSAARIPAVLANTSQFTRVYVAVDHDLAGERAVARSAGLRPGLVQVRIAKALGARQRIDANDALRRFGPDALLAVIEWCDAFARLTKGEIGFHRMQAETARAQSIFASIAQGHRA